MLHVAESVVPVSGTHGGQPIRFDPLSSILTLFFAQKCYGRRQFRPDFYEYTSEMHSEAGSMLIDFSLLVIN